ncbi:MULTISPECIES: AAA family ATPase [unclassified Neorhizobium]|uniref:AAA family ATPase n=1 Tax=unclassified Neorhizobium TaxID=2629175 RepID=UPI001FF22748|nr:MULTISPECIES: AAA family ATPase [unclassified Neorhizobium]MCJ9668965.1 AAA family ATPase [Neorhizobium sp. SHOUNA12B]MCJ9744919.1 AAA family ATPase [Neorhizobium sp. SHOUNA12A]
MICEVDNKDERDDFSPPTLRELAGRSGYICAFPGCRRLTVGPSDDRKSGLSMVGVGAHITAASKKGPSYDEKLSSEERADVHNGVWMCQTHAKLIDDNASKHTAPELRRWKTQHEEWVFRRVANSPAHPHAGISVLRLSNVGPFRQRTELKLGRVTVVAGDNGTGKSTLCEALAAFSGEPLFTEFAERWGFGTNPWGNACVETTVIRGEDVTNVKLTERFRPFYVPAATDEDGTSGDDDETDIEGVVSRQFQIEVNGALACLWPTSLYSTIFFMKASAVVSSPRSSRPF